MKIIEGGFSTNIQGYSNFQYIFNLHNSPNKTIEDEAKINKARKKTILDRMLYQNDINKIFEEQAKVKKNAKKITRGENISKKEIFYYLIG